MGGYVYGALAQMGERLVCIQEVGGSIPPGSTTINRRNRTAGWEKQYYNGHNRVTKKDNTLKEQLLEAARLHAEGEIALHSANVQVYLNNPVGIGEHSDVMEAIQSELDKMATAHDRLEMLILIKHS